MPGLTTTCGLRRVTRNTPIADILEIVSQDGGVIIEQYLSADLRDQLNADIDPHLGQTQAGSTHSDNFIASFHGSNTRRLTNLVSHSKVFRHDILDDDLTHELATAVFSKDAGTYWVSTAQVIDIGPGSKAQPLHRDLENCPCFVAVGPKGPITGINFLIALTDFTEANGATRVIPGSGHWADYTDRGSPDDTIPAEMRAGDCLLINSQVVHGGGANVTLDERRRGLAFTFQPGYLTPEEAYPFLISMDLAKTMSPRAQAMTGFRSQYPVGSPGLWQVHYNEIATHLGL